MSNLVHHVGDPPVDWGRELADALENGTFNLVTATSTSISLVRDDITLVLGGVGLGANGPRSLTSGTITAFTLLVSGETVLVQNGFATPPTAAAFQTLLSALDANLSGDQIYAAYAPVFLGEEMVVTGSNGDDDTFGSPFGDTLSGNAGEEIFRISAGNDFVDGGADYDMISLFGGLGSGTGVVVQLGVIPNSGAITGSLPDGAIATSFVSVERIEGGDNNDTFIAGPNTQIDYEQVTDWVGGRGADSFTVDPSVEFGAVRVNYDAEKFILGQNVWGDSPFEQGVFVNLTNTDQSGDLGGGTIIVAAHSGRDIFGYSDAISGVTRYRLTDAADIIMGGSHGINVQGRAGDDLLQGGGEFNRLEGMDGNDTLIGGPVNDHLIGGNGDDTFYLQDTGPTRWGDFVLPGLGNNTIYADPVFLPDGFRDGHDLSFQDMQVGVTANLATGTAIAVGMTTTFSEVHFLIGSGFADTLTGGAAQFDGFEGFVGHGGDDVIDGGTGHDRVAYIDEVVAGYDNAEGNSVHGTQGVVVNLTAGTAIDSYGATDTLISIEEIIGTPFADSIYGSAANDVFEGLAGNDGLDGAGGRNLVRYNREHEFGGNSGVYVDLSNFYAIDSFGNTDTILNFRDVQGTRYDDVIIGDGLDNWLAGEEGNDQIHGGDGNDVLQGGDGNDTLDGGTGDNFFLGGRGTDHYVGGTAAGDNQWDKVSFHDEDGGNGITAFFFGDNGIHVFDTYGNEETGTGIDQIKGSRYDDTIVGSSADDQAEGMDGNDSFDMGAGFDTLEYQFEASDGGGTRGIIANLSSAPISANIGYDETIVGASRVLDSFEKIDTVLGVERIVATQYQDYLVGNEVDNEFNGREGDDIIVGGGGDDRLEGNEGIDTAVFTGLFKDYKIHVEGTNLSVTDLVGGRDGVDHLEGIEKLQFADRTIDLTTGGFAEVAFTHASFAPGAGGWTSMDSYPRTFADVNGDGIKDVVGFGYSATYVALGTDGGHGTFGAEFAAIANFGSGPVGGSWFSDSVYPRELGDINGDGRADIVAFGDAGVYIASGQADGTFGPASYLPIGFGAGAAGGYWLNEERYPRELGDVNGDGLDDIVGFGGSGVYVALSNGDGTFAATQFVLGAFGGDAAGGGWASDNTYPRRLADIDGDGDDDIIGFGDAGVYAALANGDGTFAAPSLIVNGFGAGPAGGGWASQNVFPRQLADINGDGDADIVGFGGAGAYAALSDSNGGFQAAQLVIANFGAEPAAGGWANEAAYPRFVTDLNDDGFADIAGIGHSGIYVAMGLPLIA